MCPLCVAKCIGCLPDYVRIKDYHKLYCVLFFIGYVRNVFNCENLTQVLDLLQAVYTYIRTSIGKKLSLFVLLWFYEFCTAIVFSSSQYT